MGHFIFKFLKELNSATSSKSIVFAVILGLIAGFLPNINFFTFLIFILVLIFRIPIGLFIASYLFFNFVGFLLDPILHKTGYFLLTISFLKPFWTFFYNLPLFRWSGFNNTIVMGGLFLGIVFGLILYFFLNKSIQFYRKIVFEKLKTIKYLSWLVPNEKKGIIRLSGIGFILGIILIFVLFFTFLLDPIIKFSLEVSLSKIFHKKVAIQKVDASLKNLSVDIINMQIGDVLFKKVYTKLDFDKIVWRKYKIDDLKIYAQTNKNIYDLIKKSSQNNSKNNFEKMMKINIKLPNPKDFLAKQNLKSIKAFEKLKKDYEKVKNDLKSLNIQKYKNEFNSLKSELTTLNKIKIKNPSDLQKLIAKINDIKKKSEKIEKEVKNNKKILIDDKKIIENDIKNLKIALKEDKQNIASKYEMIKNKEYLKFSETILKPQIANFLQKAQKFYELIKPYLKSNKNKEVEYVRSKGIYIKFKDKIHYPDFVLVKSDTKLKTSIAKWNIKALNISDNQTLLNKKGIIDIKGKSKFFDVGMNISYLKRVDFKGYGNNIKIKKMNLNFANMDALMNVKIKGYLNGDNINSKILAYFNKVKFYDLNKEFSKVVKNLDFIKRFKTIIIIKGKFKNLKIKINSDLDKIISKMLKSKINSLINKQTLKAQNLLDKKINSNMRGINVNILNLKINELNSFESVRKEINKKAVDLIKSKQKNSIGNTIKNLLKF